MNHKLESTLLGELSITSDMQKPALRSQLMKVKEESEKAGLKLNIQKTKTMESGPIMSWHIDGETLQSERLFSWSPKALQTMTAATKLKDICFLGGKL